MPERLIHDPSVIDGSSPNGDPRIQDITEVCVFFLKNSDPVEIADVLSQLWPDETTLGQNNAGQFQFGGRGGGISSAIDTSDRMKKMGKVTAVADQRTASVFVSCSAALMEQIAPMIVQLETNPAKKQ